MNEVLAQTDSDKMRSWLATRAAHYAQLDPAKIDYDIPLSQYGLDSVSAVSMTVDIEDEYGILLEVNTLWEFRTVNLLAGMLTTQSRPTEHG